MITISLCMIVKDEEDVIARCLDSVRDLVEEIIIVDTGSKDRTKEIVKAYTSDIYDFEWIDDFSAARNYSFSKATMDYIIWLDADDIILEEDREKIKQLKQSLNPMIDIVMMKYNIGFDEQGNVTFSYFRERLVKRTKNYKWKEPVHECVEISGNVTNMDICITHKKMHAQVADRNLRIFENMVNKGVELSPRCLFYYSRELQYAGRYDEAITYAEKFLDSGKGWIEDNISACADLAICFKQKNDRQNRLKSLLRSFEYDTPRAEPCCEIGFFYIEVNDYQKAKFWFDLATKLKKPEQSWGFTLSDCWGFLPYIQLSVCYDRLGMLEEAVRCNDKAAEYKPQHPSVLYNKNYFAQVMSGLKQ